MPYSDEFYALAAKVRQWGRWGPDDEIGTINLIDADARRRGAASVRSGKAFTLAMPLDEDGPQLGFMPGRTNPVHTMVQINEAARPDGANTGFCFSDDAIQMGVQACTHWDALSHAAYDGKLWNGFPADSITEAGATKCGIDKVKSIVTRGVLLDLCAAKGVEQMPNGHALTADDLDEACEHAKVTVEPGDVILLRTGHMQRFLTGDKMNYAIHSCGPSMQSAEWFKDHDVAAVTIDNIIFEVFPCEREDTWLPVHFLHLVEMGMMQGQNWNLEELAADCADDGQYTFFLSATPEPITNGTGSMVNPTALK